MTEGPLGAYRRRLSARELRFDSGQELTAEKLQSLHNALKRYQPSMGRAGWKERLGLSRRPVDPPQGLYLFGSVGTGKSMLMDLFFESVPLAAKRRVHFHAFMQDVHDRLHAWRRQSKGTEDDPLSRLAGTLATDTWLLCFDEFHVVNVADAMILGRLFEGLFEHGVIVVATSNTAPDDLYEGGLQRENFLPFITLLNERLDVLELDSGHDYRLERLQNLPVYHAPLGDDSRRALDSAFAALTEGAQVGPAALTVKGRTLRVRHAARGAARFSFAELCEAPLAAGDYLEIARQFHSVVLDGVPAMGPAQRNEARRFVTLIDVLYEHRVNLVVSAEGPPETLYPKGEGSREFKRTASRLAEMRSHEYIARPHAPH